MALVALGDRALTMPMDEIKRIARSTDLPADGRELFMLGAYLDAYEEKRVVDFTLHVQARLKARAYITQQLAAHIRWDSGQGGAVGKMTAELRGELQHAEEASG